MGADTPIPPVVMSAAAPEGTPPQGSLNYRLFEPVMPHRAPRGALRRGALMSEKILESLIVPALIL